MRTGFAIKAAFGSLPQLRANDDFLVVVVTRDRVSIEPYATKIRDMLAFFRPDVPVF